MEADERPCTNELVSRMRSLKWIAGTTNNAVSEHEEGGTGHWS